MYELTGDFYAVAKIPGHSLKGTSLQLGLDGNLDMVTTWYVDVRTDRIKFVLDSYHKPLFQDLPAKNRIGGGDSGTGRGSRSGF